MRKSVFLSGALLLSCVPSYARCPNAACNAVADRCNATDKAYTKQILDGEHAVGSGADATGPERNKAIAAADALVQLWESGDCAVMMKWAKTPGLAEQLANEKNEAALLRVSRASAYFTKGDFDRAIADYSEAIRLAPIVSVPRSNAKIDLYSNRGSVHYAKGDLDRAVADYNEAIRLNPKSASAYFNRGLADLYAGALPNALADFNQASALEPNAYRALWLEIVNKRSNIPSRLGEAAAQVDMTKWPAPVVRLYLGQMTSESVLAAADDPDPYKKKNQVCEANFYIGELALQQREKEEAVRRLRIASDGCPKDFIESAAAIAELKALGTQP